MASCTRASICRVPIWSLVDGIRATSPVRTVIEAGRRHARIDIVNDFVDDASCACARAPGRALERRPRSWSRRRAPGAAPRVERASRCEPSASSTRARNHLGSRACSGPAREARVCLIPDPELSDHSRLANSRSARSRRWELARVCAEFDGYLPHLRTRRVSTMIASVRTTCSMPAGSSSASPRPMLQRTPAATFDTDRAAASPSAPCPTSDAHVRQPV